MQVNIQQNSGKRALKYFDAKAKQEKIWGVIRNMLRLWSRKLPF